jgi:hypothetical protein
MTDKAEQKSEDRVWIVTDTIVKRYEVVARTAVDAMSVRREVPFFEDKVEVRATLKEYDEEENS